MVSRNTQKMPDDELEDILGDFYDDPLGHVLFSYPWDSYAPIQVVELSDKYRDIYPNAVYGPDDWACDFLMALGEDIKDRAFDGRTPVDPIQYATVSGHGIGKTVIVSWLTKFILDTRPFSVGTITANTAEQLKTKTWAELGKWHKISMTEHWFNYNAGRGAMNLFHKKEKEKWGVSAQTCREENSEAFAGQHSVISTSFYIVDEASAVPNKIYEVREGGTTDGEPMIFDFGNGTRNSGQFFEECEGRLKHRFKVRSIDSREVKITNKKRIQEWVDDYGEDSDFVKVRVRGMFPSAGSLQFMPSDLVSEAQEREIEKSLSDPLIIGVDVARFGDNESVIYPRVGYDARSWPIRRLRGVDTVQLTGQIIEVIKEFRAIGKECSALFVDGGGVGGGVVDQLRSLNYDPIEIQFGGKPINSTTYRFRGDEMWGNLKAALPRLALPGPKTRDGQDLFADLTQREFAYTLAGNKINLESKKDMAARGVTSPDIGDALAITFAAEVTPAMDFNLVELGNNQTVISDYDPLQPTF